MSTHRNGRSTSDQLEALKTLLETALGIVTQAEGDALFARWVGIFARIPAPEREPIVAVLEREIELRRLAEGTAGAVSGYDAMHPNPHARLYIRVFDREKPLPYVTRDEMMRASLRAAAMMRFVTPDVASAWEEATLEVVRGLTTEEREAIRRLNQEMLALLDRADGETAPKPSSGA